MEINTQNTSLKVGVITLFPEIFTQLSHSIFKRAMDKGLFSLNLLQLRDYAINQYGSVDDYPYGGEAGMVIRPEPLYGALKASGALDTGEPVYYLSPRGKTLDQDLAKKLAVQERFTLICGHYKGIDERICEKYVTEEISIGDYVLTGGELPAMVLLDAVVRLIPGVLGDKESAATDSFFSNRLGWPVYTRPEIFQDSAIPPILKSGNHAKIQKWQRKKALEWTKTRRPDLLEKFPLTKDEFELLESENF